MGDHLLNDYEDDGYCEAEMWYAELKTTMLKLCTAFDVDPDIWIVDPNADLSRIKSSYKIRVVQQFEIFEDVSEQIMRLLGKMHS